MAMHLLISTLPPTRCGVGTYAAEHLEVLRSRGMEITTASPDGDSQADHRFDPTDLVSTWRWLCFCYRARFDSVYLHYVDRHYFKGRRDQLLTRILLRLFMALALRRLASQAGDSTIILHEISHQQKNPWTYRTLRNLVFSVFKNSVFHTEPMRVDCLEIYKGFHRGHSLIADHTQYMRRKFNGTPAEARYKFGLNANAQIFLCIGFLQSSKGFDDALQAFRDAALPSSCELHLVGSLQKEQAKGRAHVTDLAKGCISTPRCHLHECYLSDEDFDSWLAAADIVILPYRGVASSGVGARASLYEKKLIVRDLPNLTDQFPEAKRFTDTNELAEIMRFTAKDEASVA